ncbi:hypothetical protein BUALT_Bualt14G0036700 [Buddleja alternifolia]|uniref:High mobility group B protein 15 n=1 Tax=Buddleja alternifolia TaxID=168488 RepID=A0AAV6WGD6_9LAMI|nr:hypothetical protein BUALT_Bualt14G0036700 [Buddleja alternifolia]
MGGDECQAGSSYQPYPRPTVTYDDVVRSRLLFMETLKNLHASMGTKFMSPIVGGKDLDLFRLFVEVTSRGGIVKVVNERKWKEVTAVFNFPSSATNASFILRKYYISLLYHYEQMYFFKAKCWTTSPTDALQNVSTITSPPLASPKYQANTATSMPEAPYVHINEFGLAAPLAASAGSPVCGVIDGKFDSGYLITVKIGSEEFKGVLYQVPNDEPQRQSVNFTNHSSVRLGAPRRKRRKKSEIRKRDPAHPKPNRSGYNFFFAEQHARLKPHYHGRDREISRIIGESWNKLQEPERAVYQEKALKDKERYKIEMEGYRERLRTGQVMGSAVPTEQRPSVTEVASTDLNSSNPQCEMSSDKSDKSNLDDDESDDKDSDFEEYSQAADMELKNVNIEVLPDEAFDLQTRVDKAGRDDENLGHDDNKTLSLDEEKTVEDGISIPIEEREVMLPSNGNESVPSS